MHKKIKIGLISSKGGHLFELLQLNTLWKKYRRFWVCFNGIDTTFYLKREKIYYGYYPESRNIVNAIRNFILAFHVLRKEKPTHLISCGAAISVPFFIAGKLFFKTKLIYIEPFYFIDHPSMSGKILYNVVDLFIVQYNKQKQWYPKAISSENNFSL